VHGRQVRQVEVPARGREGQVVDAELHVGVGSSPAGRRPRVVTRWRRARLCGPPSSAVTLGPDDCSPACEHRPASIGTLHLLLTERARRPNRKSLILTTHNSNHSRAKIHLLNRLPYTIYNSLCVFITNYLPIHRVYSYYGKTRIMKSQSLN
jgi:hypothetical protein